eukprot:TRINITY_DN22521_c0_g1_i1.p1 TRINITY_DN22521_c0_g1~~TRINITY_DN22521_c0_g1_i1.p1  ORF type:complete len:457 (-),score=80.84 TRINITY_DN22521_c0_g1_i1:79-1449(-)
MSCWPLQCVLKSFTAGHEAVEARGTSGLPDPLHADVEEDETYSAPPYHWFFQESQLATRQDEKKEERLLVRAISGAEIVALSPRNRENAGALKTRIHKEEGTAVFMQQLVQGGRILDDKDVVSNEPLILVRMPRKRMLIASLHCDLRAYDLETGAAMRVVPVRSLRLSCMVVDWENARCFTGSADGAVRVWDVHRSECLGTLPGLQGKVSTIASDEQDRLLAVSEAGTLRIWKIQEMGSGKVVSTASQEWQISVSGKVALSVDWQHSLALVSGEKETLEHHVAAYDLQTCTCLWTFRLSSATPTLLADWVGQRCVVAPGRRFLELRSLEAAVRESPAQFANDRLHYKGLIRVDWEKDLVMFVAAPFALELWSLQSFEMLHSVRDISGDGVEIVSLDVDWSQTVPRAITCRTYVDWELVAGEVCIQHWDLQDGDIKNVSAEHQFIGGFDIVAAIAQF